MQAQILWFGVRALYVRALHLSMARLHLNFTLIANNTGGSSLPTTEVRKNSSKSGNDAPVPVSQTVLAPSGYGMVRTTSLAPLQQQQMLQQAAGVTVDVEPVVQRPSDAEFAWAQDDYSATKRTIDT
jgi:hypothetical protein